MNYTEMSLVQLKELAKERNMTKISALKKADLIARLEEEDQKLSQNKKETVASLMAEKEERREKTGAQEKKKVAQIQSAGVATSHEKRYQKTESAEQTAKKPVRVEQEDAKPERANRTETKSARAEFTDGKYPRANRTEMKPMREENAEGKQSKAEYTETKPTRNERDETNLVRRERTDVKTGSGEEPKQANGILEVMAEGYGFIRCANYLPGENDVYVSPTTIRRFNLRTGDILTGLAKMQPQQDKFRALCYLNMVNGYTPDVAQRRPKFEDLTPIFPDERIHLENANSTSVPMRIMDLLAPVGKGQRGMIVSPPKTGKTTLLKQIAKSVSRTYRDMVLIVLLIDERPEEVTDIRESIEGPNVEVIYSTFDELPEHHKRVSEMVLERAKRLVEHGKDVMILLDSITRLARAYNLTVPPSGRTLSGGLDPAALHMPKKFFGAARNVRNGGSLTILATALVETGSKMDDVVFEEFKGTGNMELVLDRNLSEKRIFPAIDVNRSGTRRDDLLLNEAEQHANYLMHREMNTGKTEEAVEEILRLFTKTKNNHEFVELINQSLGKNRKR